MFCPKCGKNLGDNGIPGDMPRCCNGHVYAKSDGSIIIKPDGPSLTKRELQVLIGIGWGCTNRQIAQSLGTSEQTIKNQVCSACSKLDAINRTHALVIAINRYPQIFKSMEIICEPAQQN